MEIQLAENIKKFRIVSGYTQSELAILLSVSPQAVSRWENGQAFPDITFLPLLAKYLNVSIDAMMGLEAQKSKNLEKELYERKQAIIEEESEKRQNELRILEIYEELAHTAFLISATSGFKDVRVIVAPSFVFPVVERTTSLPPVFVKSLI